MLALLEKIRDSALRATTRRGEPRTPSQALREYDVTDEGCEQMRRRFNDSFFPDEEWDDIEDSGKRIATR